MLICQNKDWLFSENITDSMVYNSFKNLVAQKNVSMLYYYANFSFKKFLNNKSFCYNLYLFFRYLKNQQVIDFKHIHMLP
jgi:hypothetical protein